MKQETIDLAHTLAEAIAKVILSNGSDLEASKLNTEFASRLTVSLYNEGLLYSISIAINNTEALICKWNGKHSYQVYEFTLLPLFGCQSKLKSLCL